MKRGRDRACGLALGAILAASGCVGDAGADPAGTVVDSAGVRVVTVGVSPAEVPAWRVADPEPFLRLGTVEGPEHLSFGRVSGMLALPDGALAVADGQAREIRFFAADGRYLNSVGGPGEGPGEFGGPPEPLAVRGDTLLVWAIRDQRVTWLRRDGTVLRTVSLRAELGDRVGAIAAVGDGRLVAQTTPGGGVLPADHDLELVRDTALLRVVGPDGEKPDTLLVWPALERIESVGGASGGRVSVMTAPRPFGRDFQWALGPDALWAGSNDAFEVRRLSLDGALRAVVRWPAAQRSADPDELLEGLEPQARRWMEGVLEDFPPPPLAPAFGSLLVDDGGRLWAGPWVASEAVMPGPWHVFDAEGTYLGSVALPHGLRVEAVRGGAVYGVSADELGVEYVEGYRLNEPR